MRRGFEIMLTLALCGCIQHVRPWTDIKTDKQCTLWGKTPALCAEFWIGAKGMF